MSDERPRGGKGNGQGEDEESAFSVVDKRPHYEEPGETAEERRLPSFVEELKARAEEAERRAREISAAYRRIDEERDAFRERLGRDLERRLDIARAEMIRRIIPVLDDFDRAIAAARGADKKSPLLEGVLLIRERLKQALGAEGVEEIATEGRPFDPNLAEAVATEATDDPAQDNVVLEQLEPGYILRGTLLRPARVKVARAAKAAPATDAD